VSYKSILLLLDDGKSNADRVNTAITIAKTHNAHLTAVALESLKPQYMITTNEIQIQAECIEKAEELIESFKPIAEASGISFEAFTIPGSADTSASKMAHLGRNNDLIILPQPGHDSRNYTQMLAFSEEVILYSGRPILFMPYIGTKRGALDKAMISYDGTPASARAIHDAIPLLKRAKETTVLIVESQKQKESKSDVQTDELAKHLGRHCISVDVSRVTPGDALVSTIIQNEIVDRSIAFVVLGGYGIPSLRQKIFGSVTRKLLESMIVPVLMAH